MPESKIYNMDCLAAMREMPDKAFSLAIVDSPYGYGDKKTNILNFRQSNQHRDWNTPPCNDYFIELFRVSKNQIIWGGNYFPFIWGYGCRCFIYWHKGNPVDNFSDGELAWTSFDKNAKQFDYKYYGNLEGNSLTTKKFHPTQKPIALYKWLLQNYAKPGDTILDTHLGSGSSRIAAYDMGFDFTGYELDAEYFNASEARFKNHISNLKLFSPEEMYRPEQARMF